MEHGRQNFLSFWTIFWTFTPHLTPPHLTPSHPATQKVKILKKRKKRLEISPFYTSVPHVMIICCTVPEIQRVTDGIFIFHFGLFFALLPPNDPKTQNLKKFKKRLEITFYTCLPKNVMYSS